MDSGNSGSLQSSSGGDEEYDSRAESISPFMNHPSSLSFGSISNHPQQPPPQPPPPLFHHHQQSHHPPTLFDSQAHNLGPFSHSSANPNPNNLYNLDFVWSRSGGLRSEPNYTELGNLTVTGLSSSSSSSLSSSSQSLLGVHQGPTQGPFPSSSSSMPLPSTDGNGGRAGATPPRSDQTNQVKSSRKRTRASRRAPTTVLTTDTSNFRQMVQEFTGIPAPPFSASSPYSRRLDLFGAGSALRSSHLDTLGPLYPFRPSAQKVQVQQSPFASSSSSPSLLNSTMNIDNLANSTTANNNITTSIAGPSNAFSSTSSSYQQQQQQQQQLPQGQTMLNMQNPILTFQSLLQSPVFGSKSEGRSAIPSLDELGMTTHEHVNANLGGFQSHGSSAGIRVGNNNNHLSRWRGEEASGDGGHQEHLGSFDRNDGGDSQNVSRYKLNCLASSSDFHPEN